jgi:hypothetical protein
MIASGTEPEGLNVAVDDARGVARDDDVGRDAQARCVRRRRRQHQRHRRCIPQVRRVARELHACVPLDGGNGLHLRDGNFDAGEGRER